MKQSVISAVCVLTALLLVTGTQSWAQSDREVKTKQSELKKEYNDVQGKNQIIKAAAQDKPRPTTGRRRASATTGYDYTQVKGYNLRSMNDRIDLLFDKANDLNLFEEKYQKDGTFPVAGRKGLGTSQMRKVEIYYVEATPEEIERDNVEPFDIIEIRVEKLETLPAAEKAEETEESGAGMGFGFGEGGGEPVPKAYSLSGADLWTVMRMYDESMYEDILSRRNQEQSIPLPADLFLPAKRGPFIIMTSRELETSASRFTDFWNGKDTLQTAVAPVQSAASGPLTTQSVPMLYPAENKVRIKNPNKEPLKITDATFVGEHASDFQVKTKLPIVLDPKGSQNDKADITFDYVGTSEYEVRTQLFVDAREAKANQGIDIIVNPGKFASDFVVIDASLDKIELRSPARSGFAPDWKLAYTMGNDELSLPRWSSGMSSLSIGYKNQMSVGVILPMNMTAGGIPTPLGYDNRLLASPMGYNIGFDFTFGFPFSIGGNLIVANKFAGEDKYSHLLTYQTPPASPLDQDYRGDFFHIGTVAQVYYPIMFKDHSTDPTVAFRLNIGGAYMQIQRDHLVSLGDESLSEPDATVRFGRTFKKEDIGKMFTLGKQKDVVDIYIRLAFINLGAKNTYGLGLQYFGGRMMTDAWLELTNWFRIEAKYTFLLRNRELWENEASYFMISPRFRFGLPSLFN